MFLSKRNGVYYVFYTNANKKQTCISTRTKNKSEAVRFLSNFDYELERREKNQIPAKTLKEFRFEFLKYSEAVHSPNTTEVFKVTFNFLLKYFGNPQLTEITIPKLNEYFTYRIRKSIYPARRDLINISSAFTYAVKQGYLKDNPCKVFKRFKIPEKQPLYFSEQEFIKLLEVIDIQVIREIAQFAVYTGLRQMEILSLQWNQIYLDRKLLILDNRNYLTKTKKIRTVPLSTKALQILNSRKSVEYCESVFTLNGEALTQKYLSKTFKSFVKMAGINSKLNFHSLRHTFASWLVQKGVSIYEVSKLLGHADIKTTQIYAHLRSDDLRNAVELLN